VTLGPLEALIGARLTFGRTPALDAELATSGWEAWLAAQLDPASIPDPEVEALLADRYPTLTATNAANRVHLDSIDGRVRLTRELSHATFLRMVHSRRQLYEVLVDLWSNHLNISFYAKDVLCVLKTQDDREVVRPHALGRFADLLAASAHSPAMLVYLDNFRNDARNAALVNVNYGRELLELHSLGIVDGEQVYGEDDILAVARVLSGWTIEEAAGVGTRFRFRSELHDAGPASILGGAWSTPGHSGEAGYQDGVALVDFLAHHPSTARHVAWKLCRRFVSDHPPADLVAGAAQVYLDGDTAIGPVIEHIVRSPAFAASGGAKLRRGLDLAVAAFRVVGATTDPDPLGPASTELHAGNGILTRLGQRLFSHDPPDGYPDEQVDWLSADGLLRRWELGGRLANNGFVGVTTDLAALQPVPRPGRAGDFLDRMAARLLGGLDVSPAGFSDVPDGGAVSDGVNWVAGAGLVSGYPDGTFRPRNRITRSQMVLALWRAAGRPGGSAPHRFRDVPARAGYGRALDWAKAQGIVTGFRGNTFRPMAPVTRSQVVQMLWVAAGRPTGAPPHRFRDVPARAAYGRALSWAKAQGLVRGYAGNVFRPRPAVNRAQAATMLFTLHAAPEVALTAAERAEILPFVGGENRAVDDGFLRSVAPDLVGLLLSLPRFQYR
jgi:uncharacterized protein (DUF1800 family)